MSAAKPVKITVNYTDGRTGGKNKQVSGAVSSQDELLAFMADNNPMGLMPNSVTTPGNGRVASLFHVSSGLNQLTLQGIFK